MPATIILGAQWGDEGKGRAVDYISATADVAARATGGDNAGHTLNVGDHLLKLHLVPSGILHERVTCVLGNGMVINPLSLLKEMDKLAAFGLDISPDRLKISTRAHLITPGHTALDAANEKQRGDGKIGTTLRGIGPAYADKVGRRGLRTGEMLDIERFAEALENNLHLASDYLARDGFDALDVDNSVRAYVEAAARLRPFLADVAVYLDDAFKAGRHVVCEGAQGTMLDVDFGSYPFVTSSSPTVGGTLSGLGFGPKHVRDVVGVAKAYSTRVGGGPMPTELAGPMADRLRGTGANFWDEFGTTTGRPRRVGWLDAIVLRYSAIVNGFTKLVITKLDILTGLDELQLCVGYEIDGERTPEMPATIEELARAVPVYESLPGWREDVSAMREKTELPPNARRYIDRIEELCETPVELVSVGPERAQLVEYFK
jgi:adenylosuccinate synthase